MVVLFTPIICLCERPEIEEMLARQENRWAPIKIQTFESKAHFLRHGQTRKGDTPSTPPMTQPLPSRGTRYTGMNILSLWGQAAPEVTCHISRFRIPNDMVNTRLRRTEN